MSAVLAASWPQRPGVLSGNYLRSPFSPCFSLQALTQGAAISIDLGDVHVVSNTKFISPVLEQ